MKKPRLDHLIKRPNGPWVPSGSTDVSVTWKRARKQMEEEKQKERQFARVFKIRSA